MAIGYHTEMTQAEAEQRPYSAVCHIRTTFADASTQDGTAFMVSVNSLISASHVIYKSDTGEEPTDITITPAVSLGTPKFGTYTAFISANQIPWPGSGGDDIAKTLDDVCLLYVEEPLGYKTGWFTPTNLTELAFPPRYECNGYPIEAYVNDEPELYYNIDPIEILSGAEEGLLDTAQFGTIPGHSGAPVWRMTDGVAEVVGMISTSGRAPSLGYRYTNLITEIKANRDYLLKTHRGNVQAYINAIANRGFSLLSRYDQETSIQYRFLELPEMADVIHRVMRLYVGLLRRMPTRQEMVRACRNWGHRENLPLSSKWAYAANTIVVKSEEFTGAFEHPENDRAFVDYVYRIILDRSPTTAELANWLDQMSAQWLARAHVIVSVLETVEGDVQLAPFVRNALTILFGVNYAYITPDELGMDPGDWVDHASRTRLVHELYIGLGFGLEEAMYSWTASSQPLTDLAADLLSRPLYTDYVANGNGDLIDAIYENSLSRSPTAIERNNHETAIANGDKTIENVAIEVVSSDEFKTMPTYATVAQLVDFATHQPSGVVGVPISYSEFLWGQYYAQVV